MFSTLACLHRLAPLCKSSLKNIADPQPILHLISQSVEVYTNTFESVYLASGKSTQRHIPPLSSSKTADVLNPHMHFSSVWSVNT